MTLTLAEVKDPFTYADLYLVRATVSNVVRPQRSTGAGVPLVVMLDDTTQLVASCAVPLPDKGSRIEASLISTPSGWSLVGWSITSPARPWGAVEAVKGAVRALRSIKRLLAPILNISGRRKK